MPDHVPIGSETYFVLLAVLLVARGADFLSTWIATPQLLLEGNPIAKGLGWKWGIPINLVVCILIAIWPLGAIVVSTTSALVAARNFQVAWLMRSLGERNYRDWHLERLLEVHPVLYLFCLIAQTLLIGAVGLVLVLATDELIPEGIGIGIIAYALAVLLFTLLSIWRLHRTHKHTGYEWNLPSNKGQVY